MFQYTITYSKACQVEQITTVEDQEVNTLVDGIEVGVIFDFEQDGQQKSESQILRYATTDPEQVKTNLATALSEIRTAVTPASNEETQITGLEAGTSQEV